MADWLFDGPDRIVYEPAGVGDTSFNVERDLYSAWKRWAVQDIGSNFPEAFIVEGGTPIGSTGIFSGSTIILTNGWKVRAASHAHQVTLQGNLFSDDGVLSVPTESFNATIFVSSSVSAQGIATGSGVTASDVTDIRDSILNAVIENGETLREQMRLLRADAAGDIVDAGQGNYSIKSSDGNTDRILGTYQGRNRTITPDTT